MEAALAACGRPATMGDTTPTARHWTRLLDQVAATGRSTSVITSESFADADATITRIVDQFGGDGDHDHSCDSCGTFRTRRTVPSQWPKPKCCGIRTRNSAAMTFPASCIHDSCGAARSCGRKNACDPTARDVNIRTPAWAVEAATALGERTAHGIAALGVGDPGLLFQATEPAPEPAAPAHDEPRPAPEVAAQALYGALAAAAGAPGGTRAPRRRVRFIRLPEGARESARHRCLKKPRQR